MLHEQGCVVITEIVIATAKGLAEVIDRTPLEKYGGSATLGVPWAKSLLKHMYEFYQKMSQHKEY